MSITQISEKEQRLAQALTEANRIIERLVGERDREIARHDSMVIYNDQLTAENKVLRDEHQQTIYANQCLVAALDRIHDVLNGVYVDDVAGIVNRALAANTPPV